jgi:hypothetical protein
MTRTLGWLGVAVLAWGSLVGCGSDDEKACEQAKAKTKSCGLPVKEADPGECSGKVKCQADCVNAATCADLNSEEDNPSVQCLVSCG